ncbi:uncharacterized protein PHALS_01717 [Plasmopara halstedii]|uniref:Uncharacterized protein n=1 Tax=Plasmopara halstedii TaxID=4781 RepID=A0A0P1AU24_PLAHL|nr:uncharacterized protein PHALS_01717 [Plasmopara halstedii]CEG45420.1 hypothetical protein PHALS_01717 [Plasmopara halstedii]|eukprot:XP_024581789.1 hypothetical protein PHALS_01717 [Plasmopara halstedii]
MQLATRWIALAITTSGSLKRMYKKRLQCVCLQEIVTPSLVEILLCEYNSHHGVVERQDLTRAVSGFIIGTLGCTPLWLVVVVRGTGSSTVPFSLGSGRVDGMVFNVY